MQQLRVALLQMNAEDKAIDGNMRIAEKFCKEAAKSGADIAIFPEMFSTGYAQLQGDPFAPWRAVAFENAKPDE